MVEMQKYLQSLKRFVIKHQNGLGLALLILFTLTLTNHLQVRSYRQYFIDPATDPSPSEVAVVLGGGILDGKPKPILKGRLDTTAVLYESGKIHKILVSGDNRYDDYSEPDVMKNYLVNEKGIPENVITQDMAGRSTYETCERAKKIFELDKIVLVSERTHLPRAIYLCRSFGLEAYGAPSIADAAKGFRLGQQWREFQASQKAFINIHIKGEDTVLGDKINLQ